MRKFTFLAGLLICLNLLAVGVILTKKWNLVSAYLPKTHSRNEDAAAQEKARELFEQGEYDKGLDIVHAHKKEMEALSENGLRWLDLFIIGSEEKHDAAQLVILFEMFPEIFKEHEKASLIVASEYLYHGDLKDFTKIRSLWHGRETKTSAWLLIDADKLLAEKNPEEAKDLLHSKSLRDKSESGRLIRLALLAIDNDPKTAWKYLNQAQAKDPKNPDIRLYKAKFLETFDKGDLAIKEYEAAMQLHPHNVHLKDFAADFYIKQKEYSKAAAIWKEHLLPPSTDSIWAKALFWNKTTRPLHFNWNSAPTPQGNLEPFVNYMLNLGQEIFWNQNEFERLPDSQLYLTTRQETYWLRLLQALKERKEKLAETLLNYNPFESSSWNPELEIMLKRIIAYRENRTLKIDNEAAHKINEEPASGLPLLFVQLEKLAASKDKNQPFPADLHRLLMSKEIFSAACIAAGWNEAGLILHRMEAYPAEFPSWAALNFTSALRDNRSTSEALQFIMRQSPKPELSLEAAQLMLAGKHSDQALILLNQLASLDSDIGYKAAWLASLVYIEKKDWERAKDAIITQPDLLNDVLGKETFARIAHLEGDDALAYKVYFSIEKNSPEARSYLAKKAFDEKNWNRAKELTEQLIKDYPHNPILKKNLEYIMQNMPKPFEKS